MSYSLWFPSVVGWFTSEQNFFPSLYLVQSAEFMIHNLTLAFCKMITSAFRKLFLIQDLYDVKLLFIILYLTWKHTHTSQFYGKHRWIFKGWQAPESKAICASSRWLKENKSLLLQTDPFTKARTQLFKKPTWFFSWVTLIATNEMLRSCNLSWHEMVRI